MFPSITLGLIHFKTCGPEHLLLALRSVMAQDLSRIAHLFIYDNASGTSPEAINAIVDQVSNRFVMVLNDQHEDPAKTHPYSVNSAMEIAPGPGVFITRSDYILGPSAIHDMVAQADRMLDAGQKPFVTGWCYQSAYDRQEQPYPNYASLSGLTWGELLALPGHTFEETHLDAGVFLTHKDYWRACPLNEQMSAWGYAQSTWQRQLVIEQGVTMYALPNITFFHQQHGTWARDHVLARQQYEQFGGGR